MNNNFSNSERPTWEEFWFALALMYSSRGTCDRLRTACLIVDENNRLIAAGYNGSLSGEDHCDEVGHFMVDGHCLRTLHAEENAILHGTQDWNGSTAYILDGPCVPCAKKIISKGVKKLLYTRDFTNLHGKTQGQEFIETMATHKGVEFRKADISFENLLNKILARISGTGGRLQEDALKIVSAATREQIEYADTIQKKVSPTMRVERLSPHAKVPNRAYPDDAGLDLFSCENLVLMPGAQATIGTGLKFAIPKGYAGFVWDKSGLASRYRLKTLGGVLDANYRGELKVILSNMGDAPYYIRIGEKIAQLVIKPIAQLNVEEAPIEEITDRGVGGFGSTGLA
ncbi:MAG: dUTP diphosphatase [Candidatus Spechtbacteria bacterium]|nr:dUTP diphosphatase [Candidatus Spechtbacteria bacterium]